MQPAEWKGEQRRTDKNSQHGGFVPDSVDRRSFVFIRIGGFVFLKAFSAQLSATGPSHPLPIFLASSLLRLRRFFNLTTSPVVSSTSWDIENKCLCFHQHRGFFPPPFFRDPLFSSTSWVLPSYLICGPGRAFTLIPFSAPDCVCLVEMAYGKLPLATAWRSLRSSCLRSPEENAMKHHLPRLCLPCNQPTTDSHIEPTSIF